MNKSFFDYLSLIITCLGTSFGIIGVYFAVNTNIPISELLNNITILLIILTVLFLLLFAIFLNRFMIHKRYTNGYHVISEAFSISHKLRDSEEINDLPKSIERLQDFCTKISQAYTKFTNTQTSVCIKLFCIEEVSSNIYIKTLCRDNRSKENPKRIQPENDKCTHYLSENTDFKNILENAEKNGEEYKYYISNALPFEDFYRNTRLDMNNYPPKCSIPIIKEIKRYFSWPLPYKSTITVPIIPLTDEIIEKNKIIGYLCIDSNNIGAFKSKYDVKIFRGIADGLYPTIKKLTEIHF